MSKVIGIDLGTTNSAMAVFEGDNPEMVVNSDGDRTTPSVVAFRDGTRIVGKTALRQAVANVDGTVYSVKRFIGRKFDELTDADKEGLAYSISSGDGGRPVITVDTKGDGTKEKLYPEQISAAVLKKLKEDASAFVGEEITQAVITVPAYFNDTQRQATKDAGKIAGLDVLRIINEPTAAAMAYGFGKPDGVSKKLMVFDLGGGTLDISILNVENDFIEVISTAGDNHLGGDLWDSTFCTYIEKKFNEENGIDLSQDPQQHFRVLEACREAKHDLSNSTSTEINLPFIAQKDGLPLNLSYVITREQFNDITSELIERCKKPVQEALDGVIDGKLTFNDIDDVLLVGGSTRMQAVSDLVQELSGKTPEMTVNPDEAVALGAAIQGGVLNDECHDIVLLDVSSMSLGLKTYRSGESTPHVEKMIQRNSPLPATAKQVFTTRTDNQNDVEIILIQGEDDNPDSPNNKILGNTVLKGIPPMPAGQPEIEVTLTYNTEGIVEISATELKSGQTITVNITDGTRLADNEVLQLAAAEDAR